MKFFSFTINAILLVSLAVISGIGAQVFYPAVRSRQIPLLRAHNKTHNTIHVVNTVETSQPVIYTKRPAHL